MTTLTPELVEKFEKVATEIGIAEKFIAKGIREGKSEGIREGIRKGKSEGEANAKIKIALSLLDVLSDKLISEKVGIPLATITELRQKHNHEG